MGRFGRNEWALHGTNCSDIQKFAKEITGHLKDHFRICYVDTDHRSYKEELQADYLSDGAKSALSDKQTFQQIETNIEHPD